MVKILNILRTIFLSIVIVISLTPIVWTVISSFKTDKEIFASAFWLPAKLYYQNYVNIFKRTPIAKYYWNSISISVSTTFFALNIYGMAAYALSRFQYKGRQILFNVLSLSVLVPMTAIIFPVFVFINAIGLYNTKIGLIYVYTALTMPITLFILRNYLNTIPINIEEAAYIDGAGFINTYFTIIVPIAKPGFAAAAVLAFLFPWNDFMYAYILTEGHTARTLPISLKYFQSAFSSNYGQFFAAVSIIVVPTIIVYIIFQKTIETGMTMGSLKG